MFDFGWFKNRSRSAPPAAQKSASRFLERLEDRQLLSVSPGAVARHAQPHAGGAVYASLEHSLDWPDGRPHVPDPNPGADANHQTMTFSNVPPAVQAGLQKLAPTGVTISASQSVVVTTLANGNMLFSTRVAHSGKGGFVSVDLNGNPAGDEDILFGAAPTAIQTALQKLAPGGTTIAASQTVRVRMLIDGNTTYSVLLTTSGKPTLLTVDSIGSAVSAPSFTTSTFSSVPSTIQADLQKLAPAGVTISSSQKVEVLALGDGTTIYSVVLHTSSGVKHISVDQNGVGITLLAGRFGAWFGAGRHL